MSAQQKFLLAVFYLCAFLALFAPVALALNETYTNPNTTQPNTTTPYPTHPSTTKNSSRTPVPTETDSDSSAVIQLSSTVALFGALVAAAVFTI